MFKPSTSLLFHLTAAATLAFASQSHAIESWSVDIQGNGSAGFGQSNPALLQAGPDAQWGQGNVWNAFNVPAHNLAAAVNPSLALVDTTGAATTANFQIFGNVAGFSNGSGNALFRDYLFANAGNSSVSFTWQITGLTPGKKYDMINFGGVARDAAIGIDKDGNGSVETVKITPVNAGSIYRAITADATGKIVGTMANGTGDAEGNWAGFHLSESLPTARLWSVDIQGTGSPTTMTGIDPTYDAGNVWNAFTVAHHAGTSVNPSAALVDSSGAASPVNFAITGTVSGFNNGSPDALTRDYLFINAGGASQNLTWQLTGLDPGALYEMFVYGGAIGGRTFNMAIDLDGDGTLVDETLRNVGAGGALFGLIRPDATGRIIGNALNAGTEGNWAGFQLRQVQLPVPEPASMSLLAIGGLALLRRRVKN